MLILYFCTAFFSPVASWIQPSQPSVSSAPSYWKLFSSSRHQLLQTFVLPNLRQELLSCSINKQPRTSLVSQGLIRDSTEELRPFLEEHFLPPLTTDAEVKVFVHSMWRWRADRLRFGVRALVGPSSVPHPKAELTFPGHWLQTESSRDRVQVSFLRIKHRWGAGWSWRRGCVLNPLIREEWRISSQYNRGLYYKINVLVAFWARGLQVSQKWFHFNLVGTPR